MDFTFIVKKKKTMYCNGQKFIVTLQKTQGEKNTKQK